MFIYFQINAIILGKLTNLHSTVKYKHIYSKIWVKAHNQSMATYESLNNSYMSLQEPF